MCQRSVEALVVHRRSGGDEFDLSSVEARTTTEVTEPHLGVGHVLGAEQRLKSRPLVGEKIKGRGDGPRWHGDVSPSPLEPIGDVPRRLPGLR